MRNVGTIGWLLVGVGAVAGAIVWGANPGAFFDLPSVLIVVGGSLCAALVSFPMRHRANLLRTLRDCFFERPAEPDELIADFVRYAESAKREGLLSLEPVSRQLSDPFVAGGLQMAIDGADPQEMEVVLTTRLEAIQARHAEARTLFENLGKYAPAFGMIGTLVGLVMMLRQMRSPASIGPGMALALLTTLYGALISNLVALPIADKIAAWSRHDLLLKSIALRGAMAVHAGDNPGVVQRKLLGFMPGAADAKAA